MINKAGPHWERVYLKLIDELLNRNIIRSKRHFSQAIGRAPNFICESGGKLGPIDLIRLRLHLISLGDFGDLVERITQLILEPWNDEK